MPKPKAKENDKTDIHVDKLTVIESGVGNLIGRNARSQRFSFARRAFILALTSGPALMLISEKWQNELIIVSS